MQRGSITHCYDYPWIRWEWLILTKSGGFLRPLYGSRSITLIVPEGLTINIRHTGHSRVFFMDGFTCMGGVVPIFSDTNFAEEE